jgi:hypothetical protein
MGTFKVPDPAAPGGPSAVSLLGKLLAVWPLAESDFDTKNGTKPGYKVHLFDLQVDGDIVVDVVDPGEAVFWQNVLLEKLRWHNRDDGWLVARLIRPKKSYLFERPADKEMPAVAKAVDMLDNLWQPPQPEPAPQPEPELPEDEQPF